MKNVFEYIRSFFAKLYACIRAVAAKLYSYVDGPAEFAGLAMGVVVTIAMYKGLLEGIPLVIAYAVAVGAYIGLRPSSVGPDGAEFEDGGDGCE